MERVNFYDHIAANKRNSIILVLVAIALMIFFGYLIGLVFGSILAGVLIAVSVAIFLILIGVFSGDNIILSASGAMPADKKHHAYLINTVEGLSIAAGIPMPKVYVIRDNTINAMAIGKSPKDASIAVTIGALQKLNRTELEGVIGHEISHIKNYDVRFMIFTTILIGIVILLSDFFVRAFFFSDTRESKIHPVFFIFAIVLAFLAPLAGTLIKLAVSRKREFLADANGALLTRHPPGLASALKKIKQDSTQPSATANKAIAHLYFSNPFKKMDLWMSTHPPIEERVRRLESM